MTVSMFVSLNIALICTLRVSLITSLATTCQVCILSIVRQHGFIFYDGQHILWEFPRKPSNVYVQELIWQYPLSNASIISNKQTKKLLV